MVGFPPLTGTPTAVRGGKPLCSAPPRTPHTPLSPPGNPTAFAAGVRGLQWMRRTKLSQTNEQPAVLEDRFLRKDMLMKIIKVIIIGLLLALSLISIVSCYSLINTATSIEWIESKSYFKGGKTTEQGTVIFTYSICFKNNTEDDYEIGLSARFKKSELNGWVEYAKFFEGRIGDDIYCLIKANEEKNVDFDFESKYLGGEIPTSLSFPEELIVATRFSNADEINNPVKIVDSESSLLGFSVTDKVEFLCSVTVMNTSDKEVEFTLCAQADEADVNSGLLKSKTMTDMSGTVYKLAGGEKKTFEVVFTGENNGGTEKQNRLLPKITLNMK